MSDAPQRVTKKTLLEEYARQLIEFNKEYHDMQRLGEELAYAAKMLDGKNYHSHHPRWWPAIPWHRACEKFEVHTLNIYELRKLPKE